MIPEEQQDQAALYVLGSLEATEASAFEVAIRENAELRAFVREMRDAASEVAMLARPQAVPPGLKHRVLAQIALEQQRGNSSQHSSGRWIPWSIAAAIAVFCGVLSWDRVHLQRERGELVSERSRIEAQRDAAISERARLEQERAALVADRDRLQRELIEVRASDVLGRTKLFALAPTPAAKADSKVAVAWQQENQSGVIKATNMPPPSPDKDYQLWIVDAEQKDPISAGVIHVGTNGVAEVRFKPAAAAKSVKAFAISLERKGGAEKKEGPILFLGTA